MTDTVNLGLPCIEGSQAQKHVTHNDALRMLDTLVQLAVLDRDLTAPPGSPSEGQRWIVKATATGAWAGHDNAIAAWQDGAWQFSTPRTGWSTFVVDEGALLLWNGTAWGDFFSTVTSIQNLAMLGVGTTADASNPLSAKLNNALFVAKTVAEGGDGHLRYKLSKESAAKTLSFLLQDNFSGRAEIGLTGDDDFHFKVSPDGSAWVDALKLDKTTGAATLASDIHVEGVGSFGSNLFTQAGIPIGVNIGNAAAIRSASVLLTSPFGATAVSVMFAANYDSGWIYSVGAGSTYAGALSFDQTSGNLLYSNTSIPGTNGAAAPLATVWSIDKNGNQTGFGSILSASPSGGIGYSTGAGGAVTQAIGKSTAVTLNTVAGWITTHNASLGAGAQISFTVNNSTVAATDLINIHRASGGTANAYNVTIDSVAAGSFVVRVTNISGGALGEAIVLVFTVTKAVTN